VTRSCRPASPGIGSLRARHAACWAPLLATAMLAGAMTQLGCSPDFKDGLGPRVPSPNVSGRVEREGVAATAVDASVRNPSNDSTIADAKTDANGAYALGAPMGVWEIKVKGNLSGDFASVTRGFSISSAGQQVSMSPLDIFAYQATLVAPADAATLQVPSGSNPVTFRWSPPAHPTLSARAQVYDASGQAVWFSAKSPDTSAVWDGTGNQGAYAGVGAAAGLYTWRVKFDLPDSSEARMSSRRVTFQ